MNLYNHIASLAIPGWNNTTRSTTMELSDKYQTAAAYYEQASAIIREAQARLRALGEPTIDLPGLEAVSDIINIMGDYAPTDDRISDAAAEAQADEDDCRASELADMRREERWLANF